MWKGEYVVSQRACPKVLRLSPGQPPCSLTPAVPDAQGKCVLDAEPWIQEPTASAVHTLQAPGFTSSRQQYFSAPDNFRPRHHGNRGSGTSSGWV
jgi:hypothetical protein